MKWANPHAWIYIDVAGKDGKVENGRGKLAGPTRCIDAAGERKIWSQGPCW